MPTGAPILVGKSTTAEDITELIADTSNRPDFTGGAILRVKPQSGAAAPHHSLDGINSFGSNGGTGVSGSGGPNAGPGILGFGGGGPTTPSAGGSGVIGIGGDGSIAKGFDPGVGIVGQGGLGDSAATQLPSIGVLGLAGAAARPLSSSFGLISGIGMVGLGGPSIPGRTSGGCGVVGLAGGAAPAVGLQGLRAFGVVGVGGPPGFSEGTGPIPEGGTGIVGLAGGAGSAPQIDYAGVVAVGGPPQPNLPNASAYARFGGPGVVAISGSASAPTELDSANVGVYAVGGTGVSAAGHNGVFAVTTDSKSGFAGNFQGPVVIAFLPSSGRTALEVDGDFTVFNGSKHVAVPFPDGSHRALYCMESPECWFEDFGEAKLVKGMARVKLDQEFGRVIETDSYHVFVTPYGDSNGLYVSTRNSDGFVVEEQNDGKSGVRFAYRIVGKRKDLEAKRFAKLVRPASSDRMSTSAIPKAVKTEIKGKKRKD